MAPWGVENGAEDEWPRWTVRSRRALQWLLSNPNSPSPKEQEQTLLLEVRIATNAKQAAVALLSSRQQSHNPALQSAASDLVPMGESLGSESPDRAPYMEWLAIVSAGE
jgi:hypothetical protein